MKFYRIKAEKISYKEFLKALPSDVYDRTTEVIHVDPIVIHPTLAKTIIHNTKECEPYIDKSGIKHACSGGCYWIMWGLSAMHQAKFIDVFNDDGTYKGRVALPADVIGIMNIWEMYYAGRIHRYELINKLSEQVGYDYFDALDKVEEVEEQTDTISGKANNKPILPEYSVKYIEFEEVAR